MNAFFTSLFVDSAYPACKPQSWIKQLFRTNQSDDSEVCTETNQFVFTHIDTLKPTPSESEQCPGNPTPVGHEQKCFGAVLEFDKSGRCFHPAGTCYKGYCCPMVNQHHDSLPRKPYVTRVDCASFCPLPPDWLYAFCDPITKKVAFIGLELSYSNQKHRDYFWKDEPKYCETNESVKSFSGVSNVILQKL
ncbi:hypothetical protein CAEBREN_17764 [Caenorhabditis brenneri]|uniref:Domain of unknown function DX domain-containing protein n=1 Tax=Caenorhabditis brenneri TaxID=135651 RepID=G0NAR9_CAEBE|nr:hypothetical protein CAEBREN_17764 [Caenorhabditis brenneri]